MEGQSLLIETEYLRNCNENYQGILMMFHIIIVNNRGFSLMVILGYVFFPQISILLQQKLFDIEI